MPGSLWREVTGMGFKKLRGVKLPEEKQGFIRYTCLTLAEQPKWIQEKVKYTCDMVGGAYSHALFELMTTRKSVTSISLDNAITESVLYDMRKAFYESW